jgi:hypothetical protein
MGELISMPARRQDRRRLAGHDYIHGQQWIANAIFHWKDDPSEDARAGVKFLMRHLATRFRFDDEPMQPRPVGPAPAPEPAPVPQVKTGRRKNPRR